MEKDGALAAHMLALVRADYEAVRGKVFLATYVHGYRDGNGDSIDGQLSHPATVRVVESNDLARWMDGFIDPLWSVELVEPHPELSGAHGLYVYGTSYGLDGTTNQHSMQEATT